MLSTTMRSLKVLALPALFLVAACENPVGRGDDHSDEFTAVEIVDPSGVLIAEFHDDHWHTADGGARLHLHPGDVLDVVIRFVTGDGARVILPHEGAEHTLRVVIADPAVLTYTAGTGQGRISAEGAGETTLSVQVYHGSHADWATQPALAVEVVDHGGH